jgi:hypothetical protein
MTEERMDDVEIVRSLANGGLPALQPEQRAAVKRILARLDSAERACRMVAASLSPKARAAATKKTYWFDVAIAIKQWQDLADE